MRLVCSYCRKELGTKPPLNDGGVTHGMCKPCGEYFGAQWKGMSFGAYLERFLFPVVLFDADVRVVAMNTPAGAVLGREPGSVVGLLGGEALECVHARLPGGCGKTVHCLTCAVRRAVVETHQTGKPLNGVEATLRRAGGPVRLRLSTVLEGKLVRVTVKPGTDEPRGA